MAAPVTPTLVKLAILFGSLSLLAFGGGNAVVPAMQHASVDVEHWMTDRDFLDLFAISRLAPGPGSLIVTLIGQHAAGVAGALVATAAMYAPSCLLIHAAAGVWHRARDARWRAYAESGLAPLAVGLVFASAVALTRGTDHAWAALAITLVSAVLLAATEAPPLAVLVAGGAAGWLLGL